jgi:hypothetical protein
MRNRMLSNARALPTQLWRPVPKGDAAEGLRTNSGLVVQRSGMNSCGRTKHFESLKDS